MRFLVVEDDGAIAAGLADNLHAQGHAVDRAGTVAEAWNALRSEPFEVVLLDLGLPDGDGAQLLARLRAFVRQADGTDSWPDPETPVLVLSARDAIDARIQALDQGADDYLVKPFDLRELMARVRAMQRRRAGRAGALLQWRDLTIDPAGHSVSRGNREVPLGAREFALLHALVQASPRVLSRPRLVSALYGFDESLDSNAIEVHVHHLRRKLGQDLIRTLRGVGYFVPGEGSV